jgi:hypothetical protein
MNSMGLWLSWQGGPRKARKLGLRFLLPLRLWQTMMSLVLSEIFCASSKGIWKAKLSI